MFTYIWLSFIANYVHVGISSYMLHGSYGYVRFQGGIALGKPWGPQRPHFARPARLIMVPSGLWLGVFFFGGFG